jgi:hypothetical protein
MLAYRVKVAGAPRVYPVPVNARAGTSEALGQAVSKAARAARRDGVAEPEIVWVRLDGKAVR